MKALSIRQPWADLILQGKKTIELRSWSVKHRGALAIHASQTFKPEECLAHGIDPAHLTTGAFIGTVELVDVSELDAESYRALAQEHLSTKTFEPPLFAWRLEKPKLLAHPVPARGRMGLYDVPETLLRSTEPVVSEPPRTTAAVSLHPTNGKQERPFELRVIANVGNDTHTYNAALFQNLVRSPNAQQFFYVESGREMQPIAELGSVTLRLIADQVLDALKHAGYRATELNATRREPFALDEESGVRLSLLFLAVKPVSKVERVEAIAQGIRRMTSEEAYYWFSKCTKGPTAARAQKALRVLLAEE